MASEKPTRRELAQQIALFVDEGMSATEIAARMATTRQRIMRIAAQYRVRLQPRGGNRRVGAQFSAKRYAVIQRLAKEAGVSVSTMLNRIAAVVVDEGVPAATRRLGTAARPKRRYTRKPQ